MKYIKLFEDYNPTNITNLNTETYDLNSSVLNIIDVGLYHTPLSPENFLYDFDFNDGVDESEDEQEKSYDEAVDNFSMEKYKEMLITNAKQYIKDIVLPELQSKTDSIISIEVTGFYSPRSYNYGSDELEFDVTVNKRKLIEEVYTMSDSSKFEEYLKDEYSSHAGFTSFMPNSLEDFDNEIIRSENNDSWRPITQYYNYLLKSCDIESFVEYLADNEYNRDYSDYQLDDNEE